MTRKTTGGLIALLLGLLALPALAREKMVPTTRDNATSGRVLELLAKAHYEDVAIDDGFSSRLLDRYLAAIDPSRLYLLASDVSEFEALRLELDDALKAGDLRPAYRIYERFLVRREKALAEVMAFVHDGLETKDLASKESVLVDRRKAPWPVDEAHRTKILCRRVLNEVITLHLAGDDLPTVGEKLSLRFGDLARKTDEKTSGDALEIWLNAVACGYDPHTNWLPPRDAEVFRIQMSQTLTGIGATIVVKEGLPTIERLVPGGPADKADALQVGDRLVGVAQGADGEMVDVSDWSVEKIVEVVRGERGSVVRLAVLPANAAASATAKTLSIVRDRVRLEDDGARSHVVQVRRGDRTLRLGVIELPVFYMDYQAAQAGDPEYRSSTRDIARLLAELEANGGIDGLVVDLRGNTGGSLHEARDLTCLFTGAGPVVQIRDGRGRVELFGRRRVKQVWKGPLAVLVDRTSASASEIFAAAIQDYGRGLVIGSRTYGKGTVQNIVPVGHGQVKLTFAKFYRVSGGSTQHRGVEPDVVFPSEWDEDDIGESALPTALPWDRIEAAEHKKSGLIEMLRPALISLHADRAAGDPGFVALSEHLALSREQDEAERLALSLRVRAKERDRVKARIAEIEKWRLDDDVQALVVAEEADPFAREAAEIVADMIVLTR